MKAVSTSGRLELLEEFARAVGADRLYHAGPNDGFGRQITFADGHVRRGDEGAAYAAVYVEYVARSTGRAVPPRAAVLAASARAELAGGDADEAAARGRRHASEYAYLVSGGRK